MTKLIRIMMLAIVVFAASATKVHAQDPYIGEIRMFAGNFAPTGWAKCEGQLLPINQNAALFAILGVTYGGNGTTNFALPDMRSRVPMAPGQGPGLSASTIGTAQGTENVTISAGNLPPHNHQLNFYNGSGDTDSLATGTVSLALPLNADLSRAAAFSTAAPNAGLNGASISSNVTTNTPIPVRQPSLSVTFIIALQGIFPTQ